MTDFMKENRKPFSENAVIQRQRARGQGPKAKYRAMPRASCPSPLAETLCYTNALGFGMLCSIAGWYNILIGCF